jgi:hypothetical protein
VSWPGGDCLAEMFVSLLPLISESKFYANAEGYIHSNRASRLRTSLRIRPTHYRGWSDKSKISTVFRSFSTVSVENFAISTINEPRGRARARLPVLRGPYPPIRAAVTRCFIRKDRLPPSNDDKSSDSSVRTTSRTPPKSPIFSRFKGSPGFPQGGSFFACGPLSLMLGLPRLNKFSTG